ncbi:retrovirus-related pol polyprotein from transposon TNT 1-94 [Tanacetum coccineum]
MTLTYQDHSPRKRSSLETMEYTNPETQESIKKNVSGHVTVSNPKPVTASVPTKVKTNDKESKIYELTKLVQMLMDEKITLTQKPQEPISMSLQPESSKPQKLESPPKSWFTRETNPSLIFVQRHIKEPIWYLDSGCSRSMTGVKSYLHKYVKQPGPKVVFGDNSSCITEGYASINYGGIVFSKVAFVNGLKYNLISISQPCDAKYIVQFDDKQGTIFNANKEIVLIAPRRNDVYVLDMSSLTPSGACFFAKVSESLNWLWHKRTDNGTEFRNTKLESFYDEKGISQNVSSPYTPEQNDVAERNNKTLIEAARTMQNGSVLSKHFWTEVKGYQTSAIFMYLDVMCLFIITYAKVNDGYFFRYSFNSKTFRVFNTRRQQIEETYHVTFDESIEDIRFINTLVDEIRIDDSSRYPPDEYHHEDDPSRQYQSNYDISYYVILYGCSLTKLAQEKHVPEVIAPNEPDIPHTEDAEGPPDLINTEGTHEQNFLDEQIITQTIEGPSCSNPAPQDRWSKEEHIELMNIIGDLGEDMLTRSMASKLITALASECLFAYFQMDVKSAFLNGKLKKEVYVKHPPGFESSKFPDYVCKLDKALYGLKQAPRAYSSVKTLMVPPNNLGPDLAGKPVIETLYRRMIGSLMYLKGIPNLGLYYPKCSGFNLKGYSDSNYASCNMDRKSTLGACQILCGKLVCWSAKKQQSVAMSSAEAEYVAAAGCCASILWMKSQLNDYDIHYKMVPIFCDNTSAIAISNNPVLHSRTKHSDIREFWCTANAYDPNPPINDSEVRPLKEYLIKFSVTNGKKPLTLDFKPFTESTGLDYAKGKYVSHPSTDEVKAEVDKIVDNPILLDRTPVLKTAFPMAWRLLFTFVVQVLGENYSSTKQVNSI